MRHRLRARIRTAMLVFAGSIGFLLAVGVSSAVAEHQLTNTTAAQSPVIAGTHLPPIFKVLSKDAI